MSNKSRKNTPEKDQEDVCKQSIIWYPKTESKENMLPLYEFKKLNKNINSHYGMKYGWH